MSATVLRFNNRTTRRPSAPVKIDASALESPSPGSTGRVLLIGEAEGGAPYGAFSDADDVRRFRTSEALRAAFLSGDLKEAGAMAFRPSAEPTVTGAEEIIALKVNPDTQASATFANAIDDALTITSRDYGPHTNQIGVSIGDGTAQGRRVTITYEGNTEVHDNIGGAAMLTLQYTEPPTLGWDNMTALVTSAGVRASGTRAELGRGDDLLNPAGNAVVEVVSSDNGDIGQVVTVYCLIGGVPSQRQLTLNGTTPVADTQAIDATGIFGAVLSAAAAGTVTVRQAGPTNLFQIAPAALSAGGARATGMFAQGALTLVADGATTAQVMVVGRNASGTVIRELIALAGATPVVTTTTTWRHFDFLGLAPVASARTVTMTATAAETTHSVQNTLVKVRDFFNGLQVVVSSTAYGFVATLGTTRSTFDPAQLDLTPVGTPIDVDAPATGSFLADLTLIVERLTAESSFVTAEAAEGAFGAPSNSVAPVYLAGGTRGTTLFADWVAALVLAQDIDCDTVVCLSPDPAVHAELAAHLDHMAGPGEGERDGFVGIMNAAMTGLATFTEIRTQIAAINNRNVRVVAQEFDRFDTNGNRRTFEPYFFAALCAGLQAGSALGHSLTAAKLNILSFGQHSSWDPKADYEAALEYGLLFAQRVKGGPGRELCRDVTSAVGSENPVFTDGAANRIINFVARETRRDVQIALGEPGFAGTATAIKGRVKRKLTSFVNEEKVLREWKDLEVHLEVDRAPVTFSAAPAFSINFAPTTIYLYDAPVTG